jgi:hypothetical protein
MFRLGSCASFEFKAALIFGKSTIARFKKPTKQAAPSRFGTAHRSRFSRNQLESPIWPSGWHIVRFPCPRLNEFPTRAGPSEIAGVPRARSCSLMRPACCRVTDFSDTPPTLLPRLQILQPLGIHLRGAFAAFRLAQILMKNNSRRFVGRSSSRKCGIKLSRARSFPRSVHRLRSRSSFVPPAAA